MKPTNRELQVLEYVKEGVFVIDESGAIWRLSRRQSNRWTGTASWVPIPARRAESPTSAGYLQVSLMVDGKDLAALAHRLVWVHRNGPIPPGLTINHKNGKKTDNRPANLELATYSEQVRHALRVLKVGRIDQNGEKNAMAKLTAAAAREIRRRRASGEALKSIAADFGVTDRAVSKIARGQRWKILLGSG
jgi:hypothetical protein